MLLLGGASASSSGVMAAAAAYGLLPPLRGLMLLSAKWGLLDLGDTLFFKTLPVKVSHPFSRSR